MATDYDVFLSYSSANLNAASNLRGQLEQHGLSVFPDQERTSAYSIPGSSTKAVEACRSFVLLVGPDGVRAMVAAETDIALRRCFGTDERGSRFPIFPILLAGTIPLVLPTLLGSFEVTTWNGSDALSRRLFTNIGKASIVASHAMVSGCPYVGLDAFGVEQARLFFGRRKETLDALACFSSRSEDPPVRWLEINGHGGSGKSSLMNAGMLPLIDQSWLGPRTGFERWRRIGPAMPGERPVAMLADALGRTVDEEPDDVRHHLESHERGFADLLRCQAPDSRTAFLLALDQFEELFTLADPVERSHFDRLVASALEDADCPLFLISTVAIDFQDRLDELPRLVAIRNRLGRTWTLPQISPGSLHEIIAEPAKLVGLDVSEVEGSMVAEARGQPMALPLLQNALNWLWERRSNGRLSGRLWAERGGLAGILSEGAEERLCDLGKRRGAALELLFQLVKLDGEGRRPTRRRLSLSEASALAGGGAGGRALIDHLAGAGASETTTGVRLVTLGVGRGAVAGGCDQWVCLSSDVLIGHGAMDRSGDRQPYWPTFWRYLEANKYRSIRSRASLDPIALQKQRLTLQAQEWHLRKGFSRLFHIAGWQDILRFNKLAEPMSMEKRFLRWSILVRSLAQVCIAALVLGPIVEAWHWKSKYGLPLQAVWVRWASMFGKELPLPELVAIPAGTFSMGDSGFPQPVHPVTFAAPFYLTRHEITFAQFDAFAGATGRALPNDYGWGREERPVIDVNWLDARAYARWLGAMKGMTCRLPSEAEWEYACRSGTTTEYALPAAAGGSEDISAQGLANCVGCGSEWEGDRTAEVGQFEPNGWGLSDMHGNVWEWTEDCWHGSYSGAPSDGRTWHAENGGDCGSRVLRGGSWNYDPHFARCAFRGWWHPLTRDYDFGFRVACLSPGADPPTDQ